MNWLDKTKKGLLIAGAVFIIHYFSDFLEKKVVAGDPGAWIWLFAFYAFWLTLSIALVDYWIK